MKLDDILKMKNLKDWRPIFSRLPKGLDKQDYDDLMRSYLEYRDSQPTTGEDWGDVH